MWIIGRFGLSRPDGEWRERDVVAVEERGERKEKVMSAGKTNFPPDRVVDVRHWMGVLGVRRI